MRAEQARAGTGDPRLRPCALAALRAFWGGAVLRSSRFCVKSGGAPSPFSKFLCVCFLLLYSTRLDFLFAFVQNKNTTQGWKADSARRSPETGTPLRRGPRKYRARKAANPAGTPVRSASGGKAFDGREGGCLKGWPEAGRLCRADRLPACSRSGVGVGARRSRPTSRKSF